MAVSGANWGTKRVCVGCGARFYDLGKNPVSCPHCSCEFDPTAPVKGRKGGHSSARKKSAEKKKESIKKIAKLVEKAQTLPEAEEGKLKMKGVDTIEAIEEIDDSDDIDGIAEIGDIDPGAKNGGDEADEKVIIEGMETEAIIVDVKDEDDAT